MAASPEKCNVARDKWEIDRGDLTILYECRIGSGTFTNVYKCHLKQGTVPVAIKLAKDNCADARKDIEREVNLMKCVGSHAHVVSLIGYSELYGGRLAILLELCSNGDLLTWLRHHPVRLSLAEDESERREQHNKCSAVHQQLLSIAWQVADGLVYLASRKLVHRDVAARNILLTESMEAKISDFVLPQGSEGNVLVSKAGELPVKWMSPESLRVGCFNTKTDIWNYGMLLFELYTGGTTPFEHVQPLDQLATLDRGERPPQPDCCPDKVYALMQRCWQMKPDHRPTAEEAKKELASVTEADYDHLKLCVDENQEDVQL
ncbi:Protein F09A5.2 [Aphelenchoides avenae]|nr:Protein F09A5.2 [Aphelenchus avenae]